MCVCVYVCVLFYVYVSVYMQWACGCQWGPEGEIGSPEAGGPGSYKQPDIGTGHRMCAGYGQSWAAQHEWKHSKRSVLVGFS